MTRDSKIHKKNIEIKTDLLIYISFVILLIIYTCAILYNINSHFIHVTEDTSGQNGIAALNLNKYGFFNLKFGFFTSFIRDPKNTGPSYAHHPTLFLLPTALVYKLFGASEATTRLGLFFYILIALTLFFFALKKLFSAKLALLTTLFFIIMPGAIYYGKSFELTVFTVPASLITWSLFVFYYLNQNEKYKKIFFWLFILSILIGCQMAWFYYFMPMGIWIFLLTPPGKQIAKRKILLFILPIILFFSFGLTMLQFYLLNGRNFWNDLISAFGFRTKAEGLPFSYWISRIWWITQLNITWVLAITGILGILAWLFKIKRNYKLLFFMPIILQPFFVLLIFRQWATHPFGVIPFLGAISLGSAILFDYILEKNKAFAIFIIMIVLSSAIYLSIQKLKFFYNDFLILREEDIALAKEVGPKVNDGDVCLGRNPQGVGVDGILAWYMSKNVDTTENCPKKGAPLAFVFHPGFGEYTQNEIKNFEQYNYKFLSCAGFLCVMQKE
jgi:4-amino-4-deoxy-L-arabinose transferase-like glycosyltransferase